METKTLNLPITLHKDINNILLSWTDVFPFNSSGVEYVLSINETEWKALYRGPEQQYLVRNLLPSTCYLFKLDVEESGKVVNSAEFRAATDFEPYFVFHITRAIKQGKTSLIRKIANQRPILLELANKDLKTPLMNAAEKGDFQLATFLLTLGTDVNNSQLLSKRTPLMTAVYNGHLQIASLLLEKGADTSLKDCNGLTALHYGVDSNVMKNVEFAVELNFDINGRDSKGWTPLLRAVILECNDDIIKFLLEKGADPLVRDGNGFDFYRHCKLVNREYLYNYQYVNAIDIVET